MPPVVLSPLALQHHVELTIDSGDIKVLARGAPPNGGGTVIFTCPIVKELNPVTLTEFGKVKRIRGIAYPIHISHTGEVRWGEVSLWHNRYATRVSPQLANRLIDGARDLLNFFTSDVSYTHDVNMFSSPFILLVLLSYFSTDFLLFLMNIKIYITADHRKAGPDAGGSPGYGITLLAETTTGMLLLLTFHLTSHHLTSHHLTSHHITSHHITSPNLISSRLIWSCLIPSHLIPSCRMYTYHWENGCWGQHPRGFGTVGSKHFVGRNTQGIASPTNLPSSTHPFTTTHHLLHFIVRPLHWLTVSQGGCVDTSTQSLVLLLMCLCPEDVSKVRLGPLSDYTYFSSSIPLCLHPLPPSC